jgi:hypothetical protein
MLITDSVIVLLTSVEKRWNKNVDI